MNEPAPLVASGVQHFLQSACKASSFTCFASASQPEHNREDVKPRSKHDSAAGAVPSAAAARNTTAIASTHSTRAAAAVQLARVRESRRRTPLIVDLYALTGLMVGSYRSGLAVCALELTPSKQTGSSYTLRRPTPPRSACLNHWVPQKSTYGLAARKYHANVRRAGHDTYTRLGGTDAEPSTAPKRHGDG